MRFTSWVGLCALGTAILTSTAWYAVGKPSPATIAESIGFGDHQAIRAAEPQRLQIKATNVTEEQVPISFEYTGTITSEKDALLEARVTGVIMERPFLPGGEVKKGQVLFKIDPRPFEIALKSAEAQKAQAEAALAFAEAQVNRANALQKKGFATEQRSQQVESDMATARANLQQAEAAIAREKLNLDYATVTAPFDGRVSLSEINVGDLVNANQTQLASVVQVDPIDVQIALSGEDSEAVRKALIRGDAAMTLLDAKGQPAREARLYMLDNRFDPRTARRLVRALVHNADERYLPGEFVRARVEVGKHKKLLVPSIALSTQLDQQIVNVIDDDGTVRPTAVETGDAYGDKTAITRGLHPGVMVAVDHIQSLHAGMKVDITPKDQTASTQ